MSGSRAVGPPRVAVSARVGVDAHELTTLGYRGGFETKTLLYETLVTRGADGRLAPGLAESWRVEDDGRRVVFVLRDGAHFHDGSPADAAAVVGHLERWTGEPVHAWLRGAARITGVRATSAREVEVTLDRPWALVPDLVAVNPCGVMAPAAFDADGGLRAPIGSGAYRLVDSTDGTLLRYRGVADASRLDLVPYGDGERALDALVAGRVDVVLDDWSGALDRARVAELARRRGIDVRRAPGSALVYLSFGLSDGPTSDVRVRRAVAAAVDRRELVALVERGFAEPCRAWAAPSVASWPDAALPSRDVDAVQLARPLRFVVRADDARSVVTADVVARQLRAAGLAVAVVALDAEALADAITSGAYDLRLEQTWGLPYDPHLSLVARFLPDTDEPSAAARRHFGVEPHIAALAERVARTPDEASRVALWPLVQAAIDEHVALVPLFVPDRLAVTRARGAHVELGPDVYRFALGGPP